jgi:hypothetical protein
VLVHGYPYYGGEKNVLKELFEFSQQEKKQISISQAYNCMPIYF